MESFLSMICSMQINVISLRKLCKENNVNPNIISGFSHKKIKDIYTRLLRHYHDHSDKSKTHWFQSELKLFHWVLLCYSLTHSKLITDFNFQEWNLIQLIFFKKDINFFKYETAKFQHQNYRKIRTWNSEENTILDTIMRDEQMSNRWNEVGRKLFEVSDQKYFRTGKQCRQHWLNHLDPLKNRGKWTQQQILTLFKYVSKNGKKWSIIHKTLLPHRTQHMIKNKFNSLLSKYKKAYPSEERNQQFITKIIIDFYQKKQIDETVTLKLLPKSTINLQEQSFEDQYLKKDPHLQEVLQKNDNQYVCQEVFFNQDQPERQNQNQVSNLQNFENFNLPPEYYTPSQTFNILYEHYQQFLFYVQFHNYSTNFNNVR